MKLAEADIPYIYLNRAFEDDLSHCIRLDNQKASYEAVKHMIKMGHTNIGGIFLNLKDSSCQEQYEGMLNAFKDYNIDYSSNNFLFDINPEEMDSSNKIFHFLQAPNRPNAIFASNDMIAFNIYRAAYILGIRIPDQMSVFGYDDCTMANFVTPPLSTVSVPNRQIASIAVDYIHHFQETGEYKALPTLKPSLIIRNSVKNLNYL